MRTEEALEVMDAELVADTDADWLGDAGALRLGVAEAESEVDGLPVVDCDDVGDILPVAESVEEPEPETEDDALGLQEAVGVGDALCVALMLPEAEGDAVSPEEPLADSDCGLVADADPDWLKEAGGLPVEEGDVERDADGLQVLDIDGVGDTLYVAD